MHHDGELYANPDVFNPWRFADLRTQEGEELKHQLVSTNSDYITFGHGKHAWYVISDNWESLEDNSLIHLDQLLALDVSLQPMSWRECWLTLFWPMTLNWRKRAQPLNQPGLVVLSCQTRAMSCSARGESRLEYLILNTLVGLFPYWPGFYSAENIEILNVIFSHLRDCGATRPGYFNHCVR